MTHVTRLGDIWRALPSAEAMGKVENKRLKRLLKKDSSK
jgi:hypothetical protein